MEKSRPSGLASGTIRMVSFSTIRLTVFGGMVRPFESLPTRFVYFGMSKAVFAL
jgi:hypothetical protein